jgi:hypothetical protein
MLLDQYARGLLGDVEELDPAREAFAHRQHLRLQEPPQDEVVDVHESRERRRPPAIPELGRSEGDVDARPVVAGQHDEMTRARHACPHKDGRVGRVAEQHRDLTCAAARDERIARVALDHDDALARSPQRLCEREPLAPEAGDDDVAAEEPHAEEGGLLAEEQQDRPDRRVRCHRRRQEACDLERHRHGSTGLGARFQDEQLQRPVQEVVPAVAVVHVGESGVPERERDQRQRADDRPLDDPPARSLGSLHADDS